MEGAGMREELSKSGLAASRLGTGAGSDVAALATTAKCATEYADALKCCQGKPEADGCS